ncbi:hypothetical protein [Devosia epidermidihirudinis]|nr:hypothetical protein [Devosia epidermidihirudinis]
MLKLRSALAMIVVLATGPVVAAEEASCSGVFGADSSEALVIKTFGKDNVVTQEEDGTDGMTILTTRVFPNDPDRTIAFTWWDEDEHTGPNYVDLPPTMAGPHGVRVGMTVAEVQAINGAPFTIGGFWWDYGGYANIEKGTLANGDDGCYLSLRFAPADEDFGDLDTGPVTGEVSIPSDTPLLAKIDTRLQVLSISYPGPEGDD